MSNRPVTSDRSLTDGHARPNPDTLAKLAAAETRAEMLAAQLEDTKTDRDRWREIAEKLSEPRPGILSRLFLRR